MPRVAQRHRLFERAQAQAPRAFFERDARHVERAMAVSLVLHHGQQFHIARQVAADELQIAPQPAEVNLGPRRPQRKTVESKSIKSPEVFNHEITRNDTKKAEAKNWAGWKPVPLYMFPGGHRLWPMSVRK